jgi:hypothetical protein
MILAGKAASEIPDRWVYFLTAPRSARLFASVAEEVNIVPPNSPPRISENISLDPSMIDIAFIPNPCTDPGLPISEEHASIIARYAISVMGEVAA